MNRNFFAFLIVPVLALATGTFVLHYRAGVMERETQDFCAAVEPGSQVTEVIKRALGAGYTVNDAGEAANTLLASKTLYVFEKELFGCLITRDDDGKVLHARAEHRVVPD
mgnify:CR=1 FL=1